MKKYIVMMLCVLLCFTLASCGEAEPEHKTESNDTQIDTAIMAKKLDPMEYNIYTNIFYNKQGDSYDDTEYTKEGIFTILHDNYSNIERYYVWGYSDETLCCDWQWEFVPDSTDDLPAPGSLVRMSGTFVQDEAALDGYWFIDTSLEVVQEYTGGKGQYDTTTMNSTLARVQLANMVNFAAEHEGDDLVVYGRIHNDNQLQHPYYDNSWYLPLEYAGELPPIGTWVTVEGKFSGASVEDAGIIVDNIIIEE